MWHTVAGGPLNDDLSPQPHARGADLRYEGELPMTMGGKIKHADAAALPVEHR